MLPGDIRPALSVGQVPRQAAGLAARPAVAAALGHRPRQETTAAVSHADRPVDETFDFGRRSVADGPNLLQRQVALQDHPGEPDLPQKPRPLGSPVADLRRGVQFHRKVHLPQGHVLHDQRIDPRRDQFAGLPFGSFQLAVPQQRVERRMNPHAETVGILRNPGDLLYGVSRGLPRTEFRTADIDGIGAVVHGGHCRSKVFGGRQQFDGFHHFLFAKIQKTRQCQTTEGKNHDSAGSTQSRTYRFKPGPPLRQSNPANGQKNGLRHNQSDKMSIYYKYPAINAKFGQST